MQSVGVEFVGKDQLRFGPLELQPAADRVRVDTTCTLISTGTETIALTRNFSPGTIWHDWVTYPFRPGYCAVGRLLDDAPEANARAGDRVMAFGPHMKPTVASAARVFPLTDDVADEEAAWLTMAVIAMHGYRQGDVRLGETVVVVGLGMLGQLVVQYARTSGAATIIAVDTAPARLELASRHGATHTLELPVDQAREPIEQITGGELAHVVFDMTGAAPVQAHCHHLLRHFGRLVLIGDTGTPERQGLSSAFMLKNLRIIGAHQLGAAHEPYWKHRQLGELFLTLLTQGRLNVRDLITHRYPAAQAGEAYDMLLTRRGDAMGVILDFNDV